jgi:hypothetical protein
MEKYREEKCLTRRILKLKLTEREKKIVVN